MPMPEGSHYRMLSVLIREQAIDASWAEMLVFRCATLRELEDAARATSAGIFGIR